MKVLFDLANAYVMPFWLLMIFAPKWRWTRKILSSPWVLVPLAAAYLRLVGPQLVQTLPLLAKPELDPVRALLGTPEGTTVGWIHFLCFDLFVGRWIYLDSRTRNLSALLVSPVLFLTLMFGPVGWLVYFLITQRMKRMEEALT
jgi:hypothetical protein